VRLTTAEFISRAQEVHGNAYTYGRAEYLRQSTKVVITCREHGDFEQFPAAHMKGHGCAKCSGNARRTTKDFIKSAQEVHGNKYQYDKSRYISAHKKITITCGKHGDFLQTPDNHVNQKKGCQKCSRRYRRSTDDFVADAREIHGNTYTYDKVVFHSTSTKVTITCPIHGDFTQNAGSHLRGTPCPQCSRGTVSCAEQKWLDALDVPERQVRLSVNGKTFVVDGFDREANTVYEFLGDFWHGNLEIYEATDIHPVISGVTFGDLWQKTHLKLDELRQSGLTVVSIWESQITT
jgi:hypothetical protein